MSSNDISVKIIRLSKPTLNFNVKDSADFLSLPSSFGSIYLGQVFESCLVLNNESIGNISEISIKSELQTTNSRFSLLETTLDSLDCVNYNLVHEVKELGIHILVCTVSYTLSQERKFQRKFYKFQVLNPLSVKLNSIDGLDGTFLEIILSNISNFNLVLERFKFIPPECAGEIFAKDYNSFQEKIFAPKESRQFLFFLSKRSQGVLGKCDITWNFENGTRGRLVTADLMKKTSATLKENVKLIDKPQKIRVEEIFVLGFSIESQGIKGWKQVNFIKQLPLLKGEMIGNTVNLSFMALYPGFYTLRLDFDGVESEVELMIENEFMHS